MTSPTSRQHYKRAALKKLRYGFECFQILKTLALLEGSEHDGEIMNDDRGTDTTCELVNFCSSWLVVVASSRVKGVLEYSTFLFF